jgi:C1A family cysteine protease
LANRVITASNIQNTLLAMKQSLTAGHPFVVGIAVYDSFESDAVALTGIVPMPNTKTESLLGGHAVLVVGYDDAHQWFIVRNSWGTSWGAQGYFYLPYAYLTNSNLSSDLWNMTSVKV